MTNDISSKFRNYFEYYNFESDKKVIVCDNPQVYETTEKVLKDNQFKSQSKKHNYNGRFGLLKALVNKDYELGRIIRTDELLI